MTLRVCENQTLQCPVLKALQQVRELLLFDLHEIFHIVHYLTCNGVVGH